MSARDLVHQREFQQVLPLLVSTYMRGRLVPFLGAGMSVPSEPQTFVRIGEEQPAACVPANPSHHEERQRVCDIALYRGK